ncbi:MAG: TonB-dependent receptor plug domain-containing protein, partial [Cyclobacteriaceae bacterium]
MKNKLLHLIKMGMYYSVMGFMLQFILFSTVLAINTSAQDVKSVREIYISIELNNLDAIQAFEAIESKTNYKFAYEKRMINRKVRINYKANNQSLAEILTEISKVTNLKFRQVNNNIDVKRINSNEKKVERVEIMTQTRTITGKVTAFDTNEGLPGVNVVEKGTSNGTVSNINGQFSLAVSEGATLVFSSVGYTTEEVEVGNRSVIDLTMSQDIQQLQELVVVAYGTQQKRDLTSSVSSIKGKELGDLPVASADALLQGKAAGVQVVQNSGQPGGEVFVRIRGSSSLLGESRPLYVIDGVPMTNIDGQPLGGGGQRFSAMADINPNDIESIEILKDAAAAALYGARGSNGVV